MYTIANIRPFGHNVGNQAISFALRQMLYDVFGRLVTIIDYPATAKHETTAKAGLSKNTIHEINRFVDGVIVATQLIGEIAPDAIDAKRDFPGKRLLRDCSQAGGGGDGTIKLLRPLEKTKMETSIHTFLKFLVRRDDFSKTQFETKPPVALQPNQNWLAIDRFALTSNNISYAAASRILDYWSFFSAAEGWGRIPAMRLGDVIKPGRPDVSVAD